MPSIIFLSRKGQKQEAAFTAGESIMHVARRNQLDIEGACDGAMACSTCHVIVAPEWFDRLPAPGIEETSLLDCTSGAGRRSRLGCQIKLNDALAGLTVELP